MRKILTLNSKVIKIAGRVISILQSEIGSFLIYNNNDIILLDDDTYLVWE